MANKQVYMVAVDGRHEEVTTVKEVSQLLGTKVTKKGIEAGEYPEVTLLGTEVKGIILPPTDEAIAQVEEAHKAHTETQEEDAQEEDTVLTDTHEEDTEESVDEEEDVPEDSSDIEYPEPGDFETEKAMKKYIKGLTDAELQEWCELEGAEWKPNSHESINRMRMAMAIKALHFPSTASKGSKKSKSKYSDYTTEQLVQMAIDNDVEIRDDKGDSRILRMYTIMALRDAGLLG